MANVFRTVDSFGPTTRIRFQQHWNAITYHTEAGYGINHIPHLYRPIKDLLDKEYTFTDKIYPGELITLPPAGNGTPKDVYIVELDFTLPAEEATVYLLQWPHNQFHISD